VSLSKLCLAAVFVVIVVAAGVLGYRFTVGFQEVKTLGSTVSSHEHDHHEAHAITAESQAKIMTFHLSLHVRLAVRLATFTMHNTL
jgi:hypothetical protein